MKAIYFLFFVMFLTGCKPILKTAYGIKNPKLEDKESIKKYLVKKEIDTTNVYVFKDLMAFATASQKDLLSIPDAIFFNKKGNFVPYKETANSCNANADKFLVDLKSFDHAVEDSTKKMNDVFKLLKPSMNFRRSDINVFITWTTYAGRLNKTKAFEWIKLIERAKKSGVDISYYLVNCDFQKSWNLTDQQKKQLNLKD